MFMNIQSIMQRLILWGLDGNCGPAGGQQKRQPTKAQIQTSETFEKTFSFHQSTAIKKKNQNRPIFRAKCVITAWWHVNLHEFSILSISDSSAAKGISTYLVPVSLGRMRSFSCRCQALVQVLDFCLQIFQLGEHVSLNKPSYCIVQLNRPYSTVLPVWPTERFIARFDIEETKALWSASNRTLMVCTAIFLPRSEGALFQPCKRWAFS